MNCLSGLGLQVWTRCFASQFDRMPLLACPAINGYHSVAKYVWEKNGVVLVGEDTSLFYCSDVSVFKCCISALGQTIHSEFIVSGTFCDYLWNCVYISAFAKIDGVKLQRCEEPVEEKHLSRQKGGSFIVLEYKITLAFHRKNVHDSFGERKCRRVRD